MLHNYYLGGWMGGNNLTGGWEIDIILHYSCNRYYLCIYCFIFLSFSQKDWLSQLYN